MTAPVEALVRDMLEYSTNLTAEALGLHASGAPDLVQSGQAMRGWLDELGQGCVLPIIRACRMPAGSAPMR